MIGRFLAAFKPAPGTSYALSDDPKSLQRRAVLDLATKRSDEFLEVQILYMLGLAVGTLVTEWWALVAAYIILLMAELHALILTRRIFFAARDPADDLSRFTTQAVIYEWHSALATSGAIGVAFLHTVPEWQLGGITIWCLTMAYFVFPTIYFVRALYGCILIHSGSLIACSTAAHYLNGTTADLMLANIGLGVFAAAAAAFMGRQLRDAYLAQLDRERDLTASVDALDRTNEMKTDFLGRLSHEMRTPMNGIMGLTALLQKTALTDEQRRQLELLRASGEHLVALLDDSLDLSRLEARDIALSVAPVDLGTLLEEQLRLYRPLARERGLALVLERKTEVPALMAMDPTRVRQCVSNLIGNAIKFSGGGNICISIDVDSSAIPARVQIGVADRGIGVPDGLGDAIFDPYAQARAGPTRPLKGVGLGLAITRRLARLMGGDVTYVARADGGSIFMLSFNARVEALSAAFEDDWPEEATG